MTGRRVSSASGELKESPDRAERYYGTLVPIPQFDWLAIFREPWIK